MNYNILFTTIIIILLLVITGILIINKLYLKDTNICDYDSCSQEAYKWNYNGSLCFDNNNVECQDFLRLWNVCQEYKNKLGVC